MSSYESISFDKGPDMGKPKTHTSSVKRLENAKQGPAPGAPKVSGNYINLSITR